MEESIAPDRDPTVVVHIIGWLSHLCLVLINALILNDQLVYKKLDIVDVLSDVFQRGCSQRR